MRILFVGNHNVAVGCLRHLLQTSHHIVGVVGLPRDHNEKQYYQSVAELAQEAGLKALTPANINDETVVEEIRALQPDLITVISYRQILKRPIISIPPLGVINLHGALLPRYRGGSPINWVLINGERNTGVTIHYIDEGIDTGPIITQRTIEISFDDDAVSLFDKVTHTGIEAFKEVIRLFEAGNVQTYPNQRELGSYYRRRTPDQGIIDWTRSATEIWNLTRALVVPFPGAFTEWGNHRIAIHRALPISLRPPDARDGQVFFIRGVERHAVAAGQGALLPWSVSVDQGGSADPEATFRELGIRDGCILGQCYHTSATSTADTQGVAK